MSCIYKVNFIRYLIFLIFLLATIDVNAPFITYGTQIVGYFFLILLTYAFRGYLSLRIVLLSMLISVVFITLSGWQYTYLEYREIFWLNTFRVIFWMVCAIFIYGAISDFYILEDLKYVLRIIIIISSFAVYLQFSFYYVWGIEIDFSILLGGDGVRSYYNVSELVNYRPVGFTSEPAIHSGIMMGLLTLYFMLDNDDKIIGFVGILSILLTFSTLGVFLSLIYMIIVYTRKISTVIWGICVLLGVFPFLLSSLVSRYDFFISGSDGSNNVKIEVINNLLSNNNYFSTGMGFVGKDKYAPDFYESLYDLTYFFTLNVYFGFVIGSFLLFFSFYLLYKSNFLFREKLLIILALIKLSGPTFMFFNFFIMFVFLIHKLKYKEG